jgi:hypothetical protein
MVSVPLPSSLCFWLPTLPASACVRASSFKGHGAIRVCSCLVVGEELKAALAFLLVDKSDQSWRECFVAVKPSSHGDVGAQKVVARRFP